MGSVNSYVNKLYNNFFQINTKYYPPPNAPPEELNFQYNADEDTASIARSDSDLSSDEKKDEFNPLDFAKPINYLIPKIILNDFRKIIHKYIVYYLLVYLLYVNRDNKTSLWKIFNDFDKNNDGKLSFDEYTTLFRNVGLAANPNELNILFHAFNLDSILYILFIY